MKKILSVFLAVFLMMGSTVSAMEIAGSDILSLPDGWTVTAQPEGSAEVSMTDGNLSLTFDTTAQADRGRSEVMTSAYDLSGGKILLSFLTNFSENSDKVTKSISVMDDDIWNSVELLRLNQGMLTAFSNADAKASCTAGKHRITIFVDPTGEDVRGAAWLDRSCIYQGSLSSWKTSIDRSGLKLYVRNSASSAVSEAASWNISNLVFQNVTGSYAFSSLPQDGQQMITPENLSAISLSFGTRLYDGMYDDSNYTLACNGETIPFALKETRNGVDIIPSDGFLNLSDYRLTVTSIKDLLGNELESQKTVSFRTAYEGYMAPTVTLDPAVDALTVYTGQKTTLTYTASESTTSVEIYINGKLSATLSGAPYQYVYTPQTAGTAEIMAVAKDSFGGSGYSKKLSVTVLENDLPTLSISGITDGAAYDAASLPKVTVSAADANGIEKLQMAFDGNVVQEINASEGIFDLSGISGGTRKITITAYDIYGLSVSQSYTVNIESAQYRTTYQNDFSDYAGENTLPREMQGGPQRGYLDAKTIDKAHGKSLIIGMDVADTNYTEANTAYVGIPAGGTTGGITLDMDIYLDTVPQDRYRFSLKQSGGTETDFLYITRDKIQFLPGHAVVGQSIDYETKRWYHLTLKADVASHTFRLSLDGTVMVENGSITGSMSALDFIRVFGPSDDTLKSFIAVDNVEVKKIYELPQLSFDAENLPGSNVLQFQTSQPLYTPSVTLDHVKLYDAFGEVKITAVDLKAQTAYITCSSPLRGNMDYRVVLSPEIRFSDGPAIGVATEGIFRTACAALDVKDARFDKDRLTLRMVNTTGVAKHIYVICQVMEGGNVKRLSVDQLDVASQSIAKDYAVSLPATAGDEFIMAYVWDSLSAPTAVTPFVFRSK